MKRSRSPVRSASAKRQKQDDTKDTKDTKDTIDPVLTKLHVTPCEQSVDYIQNKKQFQLHSLLTEQRHSKTWDLTGLLAKSYEDGLRALFSVDQDIVTKFSEIVKDEKSIAPLERCAAAVTRALQTNRRVYVYGCGATGRLAKQMESSFWKPFWTHVKTTHKDLWAKLLPHLPRPDVENLLVGEMTGADRALISSLEGFEDLQIIGQRQLEDHGIKKGDVIICVTEGGETSSVIGTVLHGLRQWESDKSVESSEYYLFFVYNNPDNVLLPFTRSKDVIEAKGITKINLATGPQSITGSTRMQATSSETYVVGSILHVAIFNYLKSLTIGDKRTPLLSSEDFKTLGFGEKVNIVGKLNQFKEILTQVEAALPSIAQFTQLETETYRHHSLATYYSQGALITVFIDNTERSPTFRLHPLDTVDQPTRKCNVQVWTEAKDGVEAWKKFLYRPFKGLTSDFYSQVFESTIADPYLKHAARESLKKAGDEQQFLYDFSFSPENIKRRGPHLQSKLPSHSSKTPVGELGVAVLLGDEISELKKSDSTVRKFLSLFHQHHKTHGARTVLVLAGDVELSEVVSIVKGLHGYEHAAAFLEGKDSKKKVYGSGTKDDEWSPENGVIFVQVGHGGDPLHLNQHLALKLLLNAHSTAVMAALGKVVFNTMTNVSPSNLKLIGRATFLIQSHINHILSKSKAKNFSTEETLFSEVSYPTCNAVLFEAINFIKDKQAQAQKEGKEFDLGLGSGQTPEVALAIITFVHALLPKFTQQFKVETSSTSITTLLEQALSILQYCEHTGASASSSFRGLGSFLSLLHQQLE